MINDIKKQLDSYSNWLKDNTKLRQINDWVEITTPFLDRHNDCLQIYVKNENGSYILTDDGYIIDDLQTSGCKLDSPKRTDLLKTVLNGYGIQLKGDNTLQVIATAENFSLRKHNLVQAMLSINDMFYLAQPTIASLFYEDVVNWLDIHDIRYIPKIRVPGKTGFDYLFDFGIPKSKTQPERLIKAITQPNRDAVQSAIMSWLDTKEVRPPDSKFYALINDTERETSPSIITALRKYDVTPIKWSKREDSIDELAA